MTNVIIDEGLGASKLAGLFPVRAQGVFYPSVDEFRFLSSRKVCVFLFFVDRDEKCASSPEKSHPRE